MLVNTPIANLYSEPSVGELDDQILYGEEADVLERSNGFAKIRTEYGYEGWIEERHLAIRRYDGAIMRVVTPFCTVLDIPKYQGRTVVTLPRGAKVEMTGENNSFAQVRLIGGEKGYIPKHILGYHTSGVEDRPWGWIAAACATRHTGSTAWPYTGTHAWRRAFR